MQSLSLHAQHFQDENNRLSFLQQQAQNAQGQTQAIQASTQIASEMVSQQQLLRQTVMAQSNAQTAYYANQLQNEASSRAELESVDSPGFHTNTGLWFVWKYLSVTRFLREKTMNSLTTRQTVISTYSVAIRTLFCNGENGYFFRY